MDGNANDKKDGDPSSELSSTSSRLDVIKTKIVPQFRLKGIRFTLKRSPNGSPGGQGAEGVILVGGKLLPIELFTRNLRTACRNMVITRRKARKDADEERRLAHVITPPNSRGTSPSNLPEAEGSSKVVNHHQMPESPAWDLQCLKSPPSEQNEQTEPEERNVLNLWDEDEIICVDEQIRILEADKRQRQEEADSVENEKDNSSTQDESEDSDGGRDSDLELVTSKPLYDHDAVPEAVYNSPEMTLPMISKEMAEKALEAITCFQIDEGNISVLDLIPSSAAVGTAASSKNPETEIKNLSSIPITRKRQRSRHESCPAKESKRTKEMGKSAENNVENGISTQNKNSEMTRLDFVKEVDFSSGKTSNTTRAINEELQVSCSSNLAEETIASPINATTHSLTPVETTEDLIEREPENVVQNANSGTPSLSSSQVVHRDQEMSETVDGNEAASMPNSRLSVDPSVEKENGLTNENISSAPAATGEIPEQVRYVTLWECKREFEEENRREQARREAEMSMEFYISQDTLMEEPADYPVLSIPEARDGDSNNHPIMINTPPAHVEAGMQQDCALQSLIEVANDSRETATISVSSNSFPEKNYVESIQTSMNVGLSEKESSSSKEMSASLNKETESTTSPTDNIPVDQETLQEEEDDERHLPIVRIRSDIFEEPDSESAGRVFLDGSHTEQQLEQSLIAPVNRETHPNGLPGQNGAVGPFTVLRAHPVCSQAGVIAPNVQQSSSISTEGLPLQRMETPTLAVPPTSRTLAVSAAPSSIGTCDKPEGAAGENLNVSMNGYVELSQNSNGSLSNGGVIDSTMNPTAASTSSCYVGILNTSQNTATNPLVSYAPTTSTTLPTSERPENPLGVRSSQSSAEDYASLFKSIKGAFDQASRTYEQAKATFEMPGQRETFVSQLDAMMKASYELFSSAYMGKLYIAPETRDCLNDVDLRIEEMVEYFEVMFDCITFSYVCTNIKMKALLTVMTRRIARLLKYFMCEKDESRSEQKFSNVCSFLWTRPSFQNRNINDPASVILKVWDIIRTTKTFGLLKSAAILDHHQVGPAGFKARIAKFQESVERQQRAAAGTSAATTLQNNQAPAAPAVSNNQPTNQQQSTVVNQVVQPAIPGHQVQTDPSSCVINQQENIAYNNQQQQPGTRGQPYTVTSEYQANNLGSLNPMITQCVPENSTQYVQQQRQLTFQRSSVPQNSCQTQNRPATSVASQQQGSRHQLLSMPTNFPQPAQAQCYSQQQQHMQLEQQSAPLQGGSIDDDDIVFLGYSSTQSQSNNVHSRVPDNSQNLITISYGGRQIGETPYYGVTTSASSAVGQHVAGGSGTTTATSGNDPSAPATRTSDTPTLAMLLADTGAANTYTYIPHGTIPSSALGQAPSTSAVGSSSVGNQYQFPQISGGQISQHGNSGAHVSPNNIQASTGTPIYHGFTGNQNVNVQTGRSAPQASMATTIPRISRSASRPTKTTRGRKPRNGRNSNQGQSQLLESAPVMGNASTYQGINYQNGSNPVVTESLSYPQWTMGNNNQPSFTSFSGNSHSGTNGGQNIATDDLSVGQAHANTIYYPNSSGTNLVAASPFMTQIMSNTTAAIADSFNQWRG